MAIVTVAFSPTLSLGYTPAAGLFSGVAAGASQTFNCLFAAAGVAANQCDTLYGVLGQSLAGAPWTIDLSSLVDPLGNAIGFAKVRLIAMRNNATTAGWTVAVSGGASNPWAGLVSSPGSLTLYPSTSGTGTAANNHGFAIHAAPNTNGMPVSGASKTLKFDPGANTLTIDLFLAGTST